VTEPFLKTYEVAELLGFAPATIQDWAQKKGLPHWKPGGRLRFRESEVLAWLDERRRVNGPGGREAKLSPTPNVDPTRVVVLQASPTPIGGEDA
jgi:excisionase family DNA binding protein